MSNGNGGSSGKQGVQGIQGIQGVHGEETPGEKGDTGERGETGKKGKNGRSIPATIAFIVLFITIGYGLHQVQNQQDALCTQQQQSYTSRKDTALVLTKPTELAPGVTDSALIAQHDIANAKRAADRKEIIDHLGAYPDCA